MNKARQIREYQGKTLTEGEETTGISTSYLSAIELGKRVPTIEVALKICDWLDKSLPDVFPDLVLKGVTLQKDLMRLLPMKGAG